MIENKAIQKMIYKLHNKGFISDYIKGYYRFKFICSKKNLPQNWEIISKDWITAWHGTKFKNIESIIENGLKLPGTVLKDGTITPYTTYIPKGKEVSGIKNWDNAIFVSGNILTALEYSDEFHTILEVKIKPNSFTKHKTSYIYHFFENHSHSIIGSETDIDDIFRITSEKNIMVISITFFNDEKKFIEFQGNYHSCGTIDGFWL